ncbi:MFS transporter [Simiduia sp. 21SJ11W-1]|uniref:MFS transporter n=1 Tax=Simiduia sp. 21SJ11W-1 TaxID=2909669 RepID=UPI00209D7F5B|nr:MFS transporter [Simiduia sp. 21SJ11W-1]UTA48963.1 MFS transporter [Simiduia sp. 21SJ11W-1]
MPLKYTLIALTLISVVADTLLLPFYPQFFAEAFSETSAAHVGAYIAACCFTVMTAFPLWARLARRVDEVHLWVVTQIAAGGLGLYCAQTESLVGFWIASQLMLVFKASYLLIYPYVLRLEEKDQHLNVAGLFSVLVHFGAIGGALLGGWIIQYFAAQSVYYVMAAADAVQVLICLWLIARLKLSWRKPAACALPEARATAGAQNLPARIYQRLGFNAWVLKVCLVSTVFYFSAFLARPYFSLYWEGISGIDHKLLSALVYSIPAWIALGCLAYGHFFQGAHKHFQKILLGTLVAMVGLVLQGSGEAYLIVIGRCLFGYGLYQFMVRLEVILFERSQPEQYAADFSKVHFFQNLGVIGASVSVGLIVDSLGLVYTFGAAFMGFAIALLLFYGLFAGEFQTTKPCPQALGATSTSPSTRASPQLPEAGPHASSL